MAERLSPGDTIGILGGGQLGRMLAVAAARLGLRTHIYTPEADSPAFDVCAAKTVAAYENEAALQGFAEAVDIVTYEFENVRRGPPNCLRRCARCGPAPRRWPRARTRLVEKDFLTDLGIATAPYRGVEDAGALARAVGELGRPSILKTRRLGYDGKGQVTIREGSDLGAIFRGLGGAPSILEGFVPFTKEVSVIAARGLDGAFTAYDVTENVHANHILSVSRAPARIDAACAAAAVATAP